MITPFDFDQQALLALNFDGGLVMDWIMFIVSAKLTWVWLYVSFLVWVVVKKGWRYGAVMLVAMALLVLCADQTATLAKTYLPKFRPSHNVEINEFVHTVFDYKGGMYGTISSHAANSIAFAVFSSFVIKRRWYYWAMAVWVLVICYSRIYLGVHYPVDIAIGLVEGAFWAVVWWKIFEFARTKWIK